MNATTTEEIRNAAMSLNLDDETLVDLAILVGRLADEVDRLRRRLDRVVEAVGT